MRSKIAPLSWYLLGTCFHFFGLSLILVKTDQQAMWITGFFLSILTNQFLLFYAVRLLLRNPYREDEQIPHLKLKLILSFLGKTLILVGCLTVVMNVWPDSLYWLVGSYLVQLMLFSLSLAMVPPSAERPQR